MTQPSGLGSHRGPQFAAPPVAPAVDAAAVDFDADGASYVAPPAAARRRAWPWVLAGALALVLVVGGALLLVPRHPSVTADGSATTPAELVAKAGACYHQVNGVRWAETPCSTKGTLVWKASTVGRFGVANTCPGADYRLVVEGPQRPGRQFMCVRPLLELNTCYGPWDAEMEAVRPQPCGPVAPKVVKVAKQPAECAADERPLEFAKDAVVYCLRP